MYEIKMLVQNIIMQKNFLNKSYVTEKLIKSKLTDCDDVIYKSFYIPGILRKKCTIVYIDGICDKKLINESVLKPLMSLRFTLNPAKIFSTVFSTLKANEIPASEITEKEGLDNALDEILTGNCILLIEGNSQFLSIGSRFVPKRGVEEPKNKTTIRGPRDGFNENLRDNTSLIRSKIKSEDLKMINFTLGDDTKTSCVICYMQNCVDAKILKKIAKDVTSINLKSFLGSGFVQKELEDKTPTFFPQMEATERPDEAARAVLSGRVVVLFDNTPFVLIIPGLFKSMVSSNEDFYVSRSKQKMFLSLRIFAMVLTITLPAIYIAIVEYSPELVSDKLISFILSSRKNIPFPAFYEILLVEFIFEVIIEAGTRLPNQLAFTVGIFGTIVLGQAMVDAHIVNLTVVIFVALTAILAFVIPNYSLELTVRILKFIFMAAAWVGGFFGIIIATICCLVELCDINFYGIEYLYPFVDSDYVLKDVEKEVKQK